MTSEEIWKESSLTGSHDSCQFGDDADHLAQLVLSGKKKATCSAYHWYETGEEPMPQVGQYNVVLDSMDQAVCITRTVRVYITTFEEVDDRHAFLEGEGDQTLDYWRRTHREFFIREMGGAFNEKTKLGCKEFKRVWP